MLYVSCFIFFFFSSRRRHTRSLCDWSSDVCSSDLEISNRKVVPAEPLMSRRRQQTAREIGAAQDGRGVERRACGDSSMRNRRDPSRRPRRAVPCRTSGKGGSDKPKVKQDRAGRESEGL